MPAAARRLRGDLLRWFRRRHPDDGDRVRLGRGRVYILPTRAGYALLGIVMVMLLGSINYANNMAFLLTFLLVGIGHNAIWYTHRNLLGLSVSPLPVAPVFAGQPVNVALHLEEDAGRAREALTLSLGRYSGAPVAVPASGQATATVKLPGLPRGIHHLPVQQLATRYPLGVLQAWSRLGLDVELVVYPTPVDPGTAPGGSGGEAGDSLRGRSGDSPDHIRPYRAGDPPGRIVWKAFARSGKLHVREALSGAGERLWLDWDAMPAEDTETRLSMLCHQVLAAHEEGRVYGLRLPGSQLPPGQGPVHRDQCLLALARFHTRPATADLGGTGA